MGVGYSGPYLPHGREVMEMEDMVITFGPYILPFPVALTAMLSIVYSIFNTADGGNLLPERLKNLVALLIGVAFGLMVMVEKETAITARVCIGWVIFGLLEGAAAVGIYKSIRIQSGKTG